MAQTTVKGRRRLKEVERKTGQAQGDASGRREEDGREKEARRRAQTKRSGGKETEGHRRKT